MKKLLIKYFVKLFFWIMHNYPLIYMFCESRIPCIMSSWMSTQALEILNYLRDALGKHAAREIVTSLDTYAQFQWQKLYIFIECHVQLHEYLFPVHKCCWFATSRMLHYPHKPLFLEETQLHQNKSLKILTQQ